MEFVKKNCHTVHSFFKAQAEAKLSKSEFLTTHEPVSASSVAFNTLIEFRV